MSFVDIHTRIFEDGKIKCNFFECAWGMGLAGMGRCSGKGEPDNEYCPKFEDEQDMIEELGKENHRV